MAEGAVTIHGLKELEIKLRDFADKMAKNFLVGGMRAAAREVQKESRRLVPVSGGPVKIQINRGHRGRNDKTKRGEYVTVPAGYLRKSINIWRKRDRDTKYAVAFSMGIRPARKGTQPYYGIFFEREKGTSKMKAQPFMRPAFDTQKEAAVEAAKTYLAGRIEKELNK